MNDNIKNQQPDVKENVVAGIVGAFLFSLVGGVLWFLIYMFGFIAGISGLIGAVCAIKGYALFAKKESVKGIIISVIISLLVIALAWYFCIAYDIYTVYMELFELGEIDFFFTFPESVQVAPMFLADPEIAVPYFKDLAIGLILCIVGGGSYVVNSIKNTKRTGKSAPAPVEPVPMGIQSDDTAEEIAPEQTEEKNEKEDETVFH